jgi:CTP synthase (UTP-ammonia lyase)
VVRVSTRIGVIGDFESGNRTHEAVAASISHVHGDRAVEVEWVPTDSAAAREDELTVEFDGLWIAPGSPYRDLEGALAAISSARRDDLPLLGTCGGFQHIVLEFARSVLGFADAQHAEYDPYASHLFVTPLSCSLAGKTMEVRLEPGSRAATAYRTTPIREEYYCNFGLNPDHEPELETAGLAITGRDADGEARVVELPTHPFFVGTLYVPQTSSAPGRPHPLVAAFVAAATAAPSVTGRQDPAVQPDTKQSS